MIHFVNGEIGSLSILSGKNSSLRHTNSTLDDSLHSMAEKQERIDPPMKMDHDV